MRILAVRADVTSQEKYHILSTDRFVSQLIVADVRRVAVIIVSVHYW